MPLPMSPTKGGPEMTEATLEITGVFERLDRQEALLREIRDAVFDLRDSGKTPIYELDDDLEELE